MKVGFQLGCAVALLASLSGCATPVGQFTKDDLLTTEATLTKNYQAAFRDLREAFRKCGAPNEGFLYTDIKTGHFDLYLPDMFGGKSPWVYGMVDVEYVTEDSTSVSANVNKTYDVSGKGRAQLIKWAQGNSDCG